MSEIVRAALEVGLPIIERDGIRRTFTPPALPATPRDTSESDAALIASMRDMKKTITPIVDRIRKENTKHGKNLPVQRPG